ncbi:MAG: PD-(D/E)XK nuclease domain-containing protein, partial [Rudanella sp.]|nr:PD-(D/E)XK nuclease domain-containing protein [Rudanella sp.]
LRQLQPITLLFQTGYLTIQSYNADDLVYTLDYPNQEVRFSIQQYLMRIFRQAEGEEVVPFILKLRNALQTNDIDTAIEVINTVFASLPYDLWQTENERFYHALIHLTFVLLGVYVQSEVHTARGRCDALVQTERYTYAFEFKLDKTAQEALSQIETKGYLLPYAQSGKKLLGVGINFSTPQKAVSEWLVKTY